MRYSSRHISLLGIIYLVVGVIIASNRDYLVNLNSLDNIVSALLAVVLWPILLVGANLHIKF